MFVPVVDSENKPLMPTTPGRARRWVSSGKATPFWKRGIWCVRLNTEPSARNTQSIAVGIDPGSKREGFTVKSELNTYLNIQSHAVTWVKDKVETRRNLRRSRRDRKTPCRPPRFSNRLNRKGRLSPSTKARWDWKLRIVHWLAKIFPITFVVVEDIQAKTRKGKGGRWNLSFSPLQVGKEWFYDKLRERWIVETRQGFENKEYRDAHGLKKSSSKLSERFSAHCVDSWSMANWCVGGHEKPDNEGLLIIEPLRKNYRNLHVQNPSKGGVRKNYGSTRSFGFERGSIVTHPKYGECLVGGCSKRGISLHSCQTNQRLTQGARSADIRFRSFNSFLVRKGEKSPAS